MASVSKVTLNLQEGTYIPLNRSFDDLVYLRQLADVDDISNETCSSNSSSDDLKLQAGTYSPIRKKSVDDSIFGRERYIGTDFAEQLKTLLIDIDTTTQGIFRAFSEKVQWKINLARLAELSSILKEQHIDPTATLDYDLPKKMLPQAVEESKKFEKIINNLNLLRKLTITTNLTYDEHKDFVTICRLNEILRQIQIYMKGIYTIDELSIKTHSSYFTKALKTLLIRVDLTAQKIFKKFYEKKELAKTLTSLTLLMNKLSLREPKSSLLTVENPKTLLSKTIKIRLESENLESLMQSLEDLRNSILSIPLVYDENIDIETIHNLKQSVRLIEEEAKILLDK